MREALKLIEKRFVGSTLGKEYVPLLSTQAKEAVDRLKKRFGAPDKFVVIRDNFAFHHPTLEDMEAAFQLAVKSEGDDTDWCMYLNDALLNTFFGYAFAPEVIALLSSAFHAIFAELADRNEIVGVRAARRIIELAARGERDPERLKPVILGWVQDGHL
jgi:hypothetical protein